MMKLMEMENAAVSHKLGIRLGSFLKNALQLVSLR